MKIAVLTPSRGRPLALTAVLMGLWRLRSTKHEIIFIVGADKDDEKTIHAAEQLQVEFPVYVMAGERGTLGHVMNNMMKAAHELNQDVVTDVTDRNFCITPGWDDCIAETTKLRPNRILWWSCPYDPDCTLPVLPHVWCEALEWKWSPEIFPFWWDDTWLMELDLMVFGGPSLKMQASYAGERGQTTRGRDFAFWFKVFAATREQRWKQAETIARKLDTKIQDRESLEKYFSVYDSSGLQRSPIFEERFGDKRPPGIEYKRAKAAAEMILSTEGSRC